MINRWNLVNALVLTGTALSLLGCAPEKGGPLASNPLPKAGPVADPIVRNSDGWEVAETVSDDGSVSLTRRNMPEEMQEQLAREYPGTDLVQVPVDSKYNATLFRIRNVEEYRNRVFIAPKLFAYGATEHGRIAPERNSDGTISLPFPVVITDGSVGEIQAPGADKRIVLPDVFRVQHERELEARIRGEFGDRVGLAPLPGCPKRIVVKVNDREYDATPADLASGDFCQTNTPFNVSLRVPAEEARFILEQALYAGAVEVRAVFETRVAFAVRQFKLEFEKSKLFRDLEAELGVNHAYVSAEVRAKLTEVIKRHAMKIQIRGNMNSALQMVVDEAFALFFEPFRPDVAKGRKECNGSLVCFRLNYNYSKEESRLSVEWVESTMSLAGQNYLTWTKLKPLQDKIVRIGDEQSRCDNEKCRPGLRNDGEPRETGLTAVEGDLFEITPTYIIQEKRELEYPTRVRRNNHVCLRSEPIYEEKCKLTLKFTPWGPVPWKSCKEVYKGEKCLKSENRWVETITYSKRQPEHPTVHQPVGFTEQLFDGLDLMFVWRSSAGEGSTEEHRVVCPLNLFEREGDGKSLRVRLENRPGCEVFSKNPAERPMLYLINRIELPVRYKAGRLVTRWDGTVTERPEEQVYSPRVDFAGTVGIKGYAFGSASTHGAREN